MNSTQQFDLLVHDAVDIVPEHQLGDKLAEGRPLTIKLGLDPTAPDIHLGHTVVLQKLRQFQQQGHRVVLIIGDYTARIGDPTGRSKTRPVLTDQQIDDAAATYSKQVFKILDPELTSIRRNSEWLNLNLLDLMALARTTTVNQLLQREDFGSRMEANQPVSLVEMFYPLLQAYDSVAVKADVELGGTDQLFNLLLAREVQKHYGQSPQVCLTLPILVGCDGVKKMSKSLDNYIGVTDSAQQIFGRTMSIPDSAMGQWFRLLLGTDLPQDDPIGQKRLLARELANQWAGVGSGQKAEAEFDRVHVSRQAPKNIPTLEVTDEVHLPALLQQAFGGSRAQARRDLEAGAVRLESEPIRELNLPAQQLQGRTLQLGKRKFVRLI